MERAGRTYKTWSIVLVTLMLASVVTAGLAGSVWASLYLAAHFMVIMVLAAVVVDHGWRGLGIGALKVIGALACIGIVVLGFCAGGYMFFFLAIGAGMLCITYWTLAVARMPRSKITGAMLLPPRRSRGATLVSVIVAMGIVTMTMTLALRAHYQGSRFVALEAQRTVAAAECQAQLEETRARGWARLPAISEHRFRSDAGEGLLTVAAGPVAGSRSITARVSWPRRDDIPAGSVELATIMSARGASG